MNLSLKEICLLQKEFDLNHTGRTKPFYTLINNSNLNELEHLLVCLMGEIGEFSNILKKTVRGDFSLEEVKSDMDEELADIFIYLLKIVNQFNVDIEDEILKKIKNNEHRFMKINNENI